MITVCSYVGLEFLTKVNFKVTIELSMKLFLAEEFT